MDAFDEMIHSEINRVVKSIEPTDGLWSRVQGSLTVRARFRVGLAAAVAAVLLATTVAAVPRTRALAAHVALSVFRIAGVQYTISVGGHPDPDPAPAPAPQNPSPAPRSAQVHSFPSLRFVGEPGQMPAEAKSRLQGSTHRWRLPTVLPPDLSVRMEINDHPESRMNSIWIILGENTGSDTIVIHEWAPAPKTLDILTGDSAQEVLLGGVQALQTQTADGVAYYFQRDGVQIVVNGPPTQVDTVRRIAESLVN